MRSTRWRAWNPGPLYAIVDLGYVRPEEIPLAARQLIAGGASVLQLRAKGWGAEDILRWAKELVPLCREAGVPLVVNDFPEVAVEAGADGVHVGQEDGSLAEVRKVVGKEMMVGRSTHSPEQAREALREGFDYLGFGPLFPTPTKLGRPGIGLEGVAGVFREVAAAVPVFAIGGIRRDNLALVKAAGAERVVVVSDLLTAADREAAAREVVKVLRRLP